MAVRISGCIKENVLASIWKKRLLKVIWAWCIHFSKKTPKNQKKKASSTKLAVVSGEIRAWFLGRRKVFHVENIGTMQLLQMDYISSKAMYVHFQLRGR